MDCYTDYLNTTALTLSPDDECYEEKLLSIAAHFRSFNDALSQFISEHGYDGADDAETKATFIKLKFSEAGIPMPRDVKNWFAGTKTIKRDTAFQICFAFGLDVNNTNDFFRKVYLERSFDCHTISEAVYYYCIRNGLSYNAALEIIAKMPKVKKGPINTKQEILYTGSIISFINGVKNADELIAYVTDHIEQFGYNNATATKHIQELWNTISCQSGIAFKEGQLRDKAFNQYHEGDAGSADDYTVVSEQADSIWKVYAQMFGLDKYQTVKYGTNRTIKPLLENNQLLPPLAEASFPDRDGIEKITNGIHVSHERIRKLMILLEFYVFWANVIIRNNDAFAIAAEHDAERCIDKINSYLLEAGYPELYPGNPYDWIFMWAVRDQRPLLAFREHMIALYAYKSDQLAEQESQ